MPSHEKRNSFRIGEPENSGLSKIQLVDVREQARGG